MHSFPQGTDARTREAQAFVVLVAEHELFTVEEKREELRKSRFAVLEACRKVNSGEVGRRWRGRQAKKGPSVSSSFCVAIKFVHCALLFWFGIERRDAEQSHAGWNCYRLSLPYREESESEVYKGWGVRALAHCFSTLSIFRWH